MSSLRRFFAFAVFFQPIWLFAQKPPAPEKAVVLYDAKLEMTCVTTESTPNCISIPSSNPPLLHIESVFPLRVTNGRLLAQYTLHFASQGTPALASVPVLAGGRVLALNLEVPLPPLTGAESSAIVKWTTNSILDSLLDLGDGETPQSNLSRQKLELSRERSGLAAEIQGFWNTYEAIVGKPHQVVDCRVVGPTGLALDACTSLELGESKKNLVPNAYGPISDDAFLKEAHHWQARFEEVQAFSREFNANKFGTRAVQLVSRILASERNLEAFNSNLQSCLDATSILKVLETPGSGLALKARAQIKSHTLGMHGEEASSAQVSEAEQNLYADTYERMLQTPASLPRINIASLETFCSASPETILQKDAFDSDLKDLRDRILREIPQLMNSINNTQTQAIEYLNSVYETTTHPPTETNYAADFGRSGRTLSYTIGALERFRPYVLVWTATKDDGPVSSTAETREMVVSSGAFAVSGPRKGVVSRLGHSLQSIF